MISTHDPSRAFGGGRRGRPVRSGAEVGTSGPEPARHVVVMGPPGAGSTTLAVVIATSLGLDMLAADDVRGVGGFAGSGRGSVIDGLPVGAAGLEALLARPIDVAIDVCVPIEVVIDRALRRRACPACGWVELASIDAPRALRCPSDGVEMIRPARSRSSAVLHGLDAYDAARRVLGRRRPDVRVIPISGASLPDEVRRGVLEALGVGLSSGGQLRSSG